MSRFANQVSSEPAVFLYSVAIGIYAAVFPNFIRQKFCNPGAEPAFDYLCNDTGPLLEATDLTTTRNTLREFVPILVLLLAGSWRDATGKNKPLMCSALIGEVVAVSIELLAVWNWSITPWIPSVIASVLYGLSGGSKLFYVGATCAITDRSSTDDRTTRYAIYQTAAYTGSCLASSISGYCLQYLGYQRLFVLVISLHLFSLILVISLKQEGNENKNGKIEILQKMKAVYKPRSNSIIIWLMVISCVIINVSSAAESNLYLYYLQEGFGFTVREAGVYLAFRLMFGVLSIMILSPVLTKILKWSDFRIGIISTAVTLISTTSMVFAKTTLQLIIFALLDFLKIFVFTLPMAIVTKCLKSDEVGVFVSLRFIGGCLSPIFVFYLYDCIFSATSQTKPGAFFLASAVITFLVFVCFCICPCIYRAPQDEYLENNTNYGDVEKIDKNSCENTEFIKTSIDIIEN